MTNPEELNALADRVEMERPTERLHEAIGIVMGVKPRRVFRGGHYIFEVKPTDGADSDPPKVRE